MKRTKIVATFGPSISAPKVLSQAVAAGVNIVRVNCAHGLARDFVRAADTVRNTTRSEKFPVGLLFDISGPKLRLDRFEGRIPIKPGQTLTLTTDKTDLNKREIAVNHESLIGSIAKGHRVFIDDGSVMFEATRAGRSRVTLEAVNGGTISGGKGINLPDSVIKIETITEKDREDIKTAIRVKADFVALSFVRSVEDITTARQIIKSFGGDQKIIAKLEKREAIERLDGILEVADGVMVARGDLGVELPLEQIPRLQKEIIAKANQHHKPVIVATQMLESMIGSPRPTRAEVNDVATAVFDYADAVMLSAETAVGRYPVETVKTMTEIITSTEGGLSRKSIDLGSHKVKSSSTLAIARAVSDSIDQCLTRAICAFTNSGFTASLISNLLPQPVVVALTSHERVMRSLVIHRSVYPILIEPLTDFDSMLKKVEEAVQSLKLAGPGDKVIVTGGIPHGVKGQTNFMLFHDVTGGKPEKPSKPAGPGRPRRGGRNVRKS